MSKVLEAVGRFPRTRLLSGSTPLDRLDRLSDHLGIDLWIKRDDLTSLGFGGNKIRQLEFYLGEAQKAGADTILITGAVQSNFVRSAAAAAARLGMQAVLQLEERVPGMEPEYRTSGNVLLGRLLDADYLSYPEGEDEVGADKALRERAAELAAEGRSPYVIPLGIDNPPLGALGYVAAGQEIASQLSDAHGADFDDVVVASGSGLTHAGLLVGLGASGMGAAVHGICVRRDANAQSRRIETVMRNLAALLDTDLPAAEHLVHTWDGALAPGYGRLGDPANEALHMMARMEGLFLDPVYTAKSFAGVIGLVREGRIASGARVLFVHTGGLPALFAYETVLQPD